MKSGLISSIIILLLLLLVATKNWQVRDQLLQTKYDLLHRNEAVTTHQAIDAIFENIETLSFKDLDDEYLSYTKSDEKKYQQLVEGLTYYRIKRNDLNKRIAGRFRLKDFICKDDYYIDCIRNKSPEVICIFNKKIFHKTIELIHALESKNYNADAFTVINGHRHPTYNEKIGGASLSRHIKGEAVDITVGDINKDGYIRKDDKDIILDLLDKEIIKDKGGIGLYPGTSNVHYDVRGTRARWNSY